MLLEALRPSEDLVNQVIEVAIDDGDVVITHYALPGS